MSIKTLRRMCISVAVASVSSLGLGLRVQQPWIAGFHPLDESPYQPSPLNAKKAAMLRLDTKMFYDTTDIDFEKRQITFRRTDSLGYIMWEFHYGELSDYLASRSSYALGLSWKKGVTAMQPSGIAAEKHGMKLEWELPVQYPTWAQRVLGKEPPKLTIDGFLEIAFGYENIQYDENIASERYRPTNNFNFDINYSFTITGSVGRLISINIRADKEQNFEISDNLKNFKIEYKESTPGELEDEIIQEVIVGYTGFSMPGTNLSGYSESHEGLFGIKVRSKLGPLELTSIASFEQGQSNKKTYSSSGTGTGEVRKEAKDFLRDRYFFLDNYYRRYYIKKYAPQNVNPASPPRVVNLSVWRKYDRTVTEKKSHIKSVKTDTLDQTYLYERLERDKHYYLNEEEGWIRFADSVSLQPQQQVAIFMRTEKADDPAYAQLQKGLMDIVQRYDSLSQTTVPDTQWTLWTIRLMEPSIDSAAIDTSRFFLMWRHAYGPADYSDPASFKISVKRIDENTGGQKVEQTDKGFYTTILGLADKNNTPMIQNPLVYNKQFGDLIFPPFDTSWAGLDVFDNPLLGEFRDPVIYRYSDALIRRKLSEGYKNIYEIEMSGTKKKTVFDDLGWGILPGTDLVKADGTTLIRDQDYDINYDMGIIELKSPRAKAAEKIEIEYQSEALFVPERKSFFGTHGKINLPFISEKSYAGGSFLFQSTESNEDIPRIDQEPYRKLLLDFNTHIELEPEWMTKLVSALPLVKTHAGSSVSFDLEVAHSRINPNKRGSAYVDDFEDSKQSEPLSNSYQSWYLASLPVPPESLWYHPPAWDFFWFSPRDNDAVHRVRRDEIVVLSEEEKRATMLGSEYEYVLRLHAIPSPPVDSLAPRFGKSWAGIMTPISQSFANKKEAQYFEFFVKDDGGFNNKGKLIIQMGEMREDVSLNGGPPNRLEDREDTAQTMRSQTDNRELDLGWDLLRDEDEVYLIPSSVPGKWDTLRYGDSLLGIHALDPAKDNWRQYYFEDGNVNNYRYVCRRQGDGKTVGSSEDITFDGTVQISVPERYYQFTIDLSDSSSPLIDRTVKYARPGIWRKYRIPLHEKFRGHELVCDSVNNPTWSNITTVRLIWTDFDPGQLSKEQSLVFYNMEFVGNQWIAVEDSARVKIRSSVVNTREDKDYEKIWEKYKGYIHRERDEYGYELEQALRLNFINLVPGDSAFVRKSFQYHNLNLSAYERLSLEVFGVRPPGTDAPLNRPLYEGNIRFVFRFGTDDSTYYEYSREIFPEWNNHISIDLKQISNLKDAFMVGHRDSAIEISDGTLRVKAPRGKQPNFSRVLWMALGVVRTYASNGIDSLSGEIWVNEMKLTGIRNINGSASRVDIMTKWADLLSLQARMEYENGDFRRMTETKNTPDNTQLTSSVGASMGLEKFLPQEWGLSLPAGVTYNSTVVRPQLKNETDVFLLNEKGKPDGFTDIVGDAMSAMMDIEQRNNKMTRAEEYQTSNIGRTYYTGYKKTKRDENPIVSFLADRWSADARYNKSINEVRYGINTDGTGEEVFFVRCDTTDNYSGKVQYDLTPYKPPEWLNWSPFRSVKQDWFPSRLKNYELTLLPRSFTVDVADINFGRQRQIDTWRGTRSFTNNYTVRHNASISYTPLSPILDMNYTLGINRDLVASADDETLEKGRKIFKRDEMWENYWILWGEKDRTQHAGMKLSPQFFEWLTTSADYTSDYGASVVYWMKEPDPYLNTKLKSSLSLDGTIEFDRLFNELKTATEKSPFMGLFDMMKKGFDGIGLRQITLSYRAESNLKNDYVGTSLLERQGISGVKDFTLFQFGVKGRTPLDILTGDMDDERFLGMRSRRLYDRSDFYRNDSRSIERSLRLSSGLSIKKLDLSFNQISLGSTVNYTLYPDTSRSDTTLTFPDLSIGLSTQALNRIGLIKNNLQSVSLNSSFTWRRSDRLTAQQIGGSSRSDKLDFMPLLSLSGSLKKWPVSFDYRHNYSREKNTTLSAERKSLDVNKNATLHSDELTVNYQIEQNSRLSEIRLLMWTIPIKGRTTVGLKFNRNSERETESDRNDKNLSVVPNLSYIFTDNVTGRLDFTFRQQDRGGQKTTTTELMCTVKITF